MKAKLIFDLSDPEDALEYRRCTAAEGAMRSLSDIRKYLYNENHDERADYTLALTKLADILEAHGVDLEELWP